MENVKKVTKREVINAMLKEEVIKSNETYVNFLTHEIELLDKKSSSRSNKPTANQKANEDIKAQIVEGLATVGKAVTISELQKEVETLAEYTNQKLSALMKQLVESGEITKIIDKKKSFFTIAE